MKFSVTRLGGAVLLSAVLCGSTFAQSVTSPPSIGQIQNLQRTAMKIGIASAAIGIGITVITLALRHHHHSDRASKADNYKSPAADYVRASRQAEARNRNPSAEGVAPAQAEQVDQNQGANLSGNLPLSTRTCYGDSIAAAANNR